MVLGRLRLGWNWSYSKIKIIRNTSNKIMKELILICAYCPDDRRENILNDCINSLQKCRNEYDILISSHTEIPKYISQKVDYTFYDKNNDLITDLKYLNQPWFSPTNSITILSTYVSKFSPYLAVYRLLIFGLGFAKMFKYKKIHYIEYDTIINDLSEIYDNSKLLDNYDNVVIQKEEKSRESNISWPIHNFMSFKVDKIDEMLTTYDKEKLLEILLKSTSKCNEKITNDIIKLNNNTVYIKDYNIVKNKIQFSLSDDILEKGHNCWAIPFYNTKEDKIYALVWNNVDENPINVNFIINNKKILSFENIKKFNWSMDIIGDIQEINSILILVNNEVKINIEFDENNRELFKQTNYSQYKI